MKKLLLGSVAAAALMVGPAVAADMRAPVRKAPPPAVAAYNWTGCYIGAYVGGAWGNSVDTMDPQSTGGAFAAGTFYNTPTANAANGGLYSYDLDSSVIGGGTLGCNWQAPGTAFVLGFEAEGGYLSLDGSAVNPYSVPTFGSDTAESTKVGDWYAVIAGRLGVAIDRTLFYVKGGAGFTEVKTTISDVCSTGACGGGTLTATGSSDKVFWVVGGGIEWAWTGNWTIKAEYLFLGLDHDYSVCGPGGAAAAGSTFCATTSVDGIHTAKIGLNYKFGGPVVARY